jgi:hypothetical protein
MALKPETSITIAALSGLMVYGIFNVEVGPSVTDVKSAAPYNSAINGSTRSATLTSIAVVSGISLLAKDPTIFLVGGSVAALLSWKYKHANTVSPATGQVTMPPTSGQPAPNTTVNASGM